MHARVWMGVGVEGENPKLTPLSAESDVGLDPTILRWSELESRVIHSTYWATQMPQELMYF